MAKKTVLVSDMSGQEIPDVKGAIIRIVFHDARKGVRELDVTDRFRTESVSRDEGGERSLRRKPGTGSRRRKEFLGAGRVHRPAQPDRNERCRQNPGAHAS